MKDEDVIRASELGQYAFCAKAWWLGSIEGVPNANVREMDAGTSMHERHGQAVQLSAWLSRAGMICLLLGLLTLVLFVLTR
jgi:hypothetical protein